MDSINVVDRGHYLTVWSRFGPSDRAAFDRLAYRRRVLFEYFAHMACLVSVEHLARWRGVMDNLAAHRTGWRLWAKKNAKVVRAVEDAIRERGPLANSDFKHPRPKGESGWWNWKPANFALNYLWLTGHTAVHSRVHFQKRYDLIERVFPGVRDLAPTSPDEFHRWHVTQSLHAMGAATGADLRMYLTYPRACRRSAQRALDALLRSGEGRGDRGSKAMLRAGSRSPPTIPRLAAAARRRHAARGSALLSPFDSFLWHRERTKRLFGYDYRIEVYTPGHKRGARLLRAADLPRRPSRRPARRQGHRAEQQARGAQRPLRAVAREGYSCTRGGVGHVSPDAALAGSQTRSARSRPSGRRALHARARGARRG
jgi:uncharacterized protein YcaQ